ncbi:hypothetical protein LCGC14_0478500 [marine sediment metagenome]|uniref:Uncharacterized protein n=1 Tax=marine sediment metagenome TaxID=412755 RepID=A0A0F9UWY4_9ZZZZ
MKTKFSYSKSATAFGTTHVFSGPGLCRYSNAIHLLQPFNDWAVKCYTYADDEAETIVSLLRQAFDAGKEEAKKELRQWLNVKGRDERR